MPTLRYVNMDLNKILQSRQNRSERLGRPFKIFYESFAQCAKAGELILEGELNTEVANLLERSAVITTVTSIEVYYKDLLSLIFKSCEPSFFEPHLKQLHSEKYDVAEILEFYEHNVHPLDIVLASQSFQNIDRIDRVFSKFLPKGGLWSNVIGMQIRLKDQPGTESTFEESSLTKLKMLFDLRHELVHDPVRRSFFTEDTLDWMYCSAHMVAGTDILLGQSIVSNLNPDFKRMLEQKEALRESNLIR